MQARYSVEAVYTSRNVGVEGLEVRVGLPGRIESSAATPLGLLAASLASCVGVTLELASEALRKDVKIAEVRAKLEFDLRRHELVSAEVMVRGEGIDEKMVKIVEERCTVGRVLRKAGVSIKFLLQQA